LVLNKSVKRAIITNPSKANPYPSINLTQTKEFSEVETITHPKEKIEDKPKIFLTLFCFTLPSLPNIVLSPPNISNKKDRFLRDNKIKGITFCQIDKTQIIPQTNF
jgi:hypothetical protein